MRKKSDFILYTNDRVMVDELTDEEAGKLFKAVFAFADCGEDRSEELPPLPRVIFKRMADYIIKNTMAYLEKCEKNKQIAMEREQKRREML